MNNSIFTWSYWSKITSVSLQTVWCLLCVHVLILEILQVIHSIMVFILFCSSILPFCVYWPMMHSCVLRDTVPLWQANFPSGINTFLSYLILLSSHKFISSDKWMSRLDCAIYHRFLASRKDGGNTLVQSFWSVFLNCWSRFQTSKPASEF